MAKTQIDEINRNIYDIKNQDDYEFKMQKGLSREIVEEISKRKNEPDWMLEIRLKALEMYEKLELPTWGPDLSELKMDEIATYVKPKTNLNSSWDDVPEEIPGISTMNFLKYAKNKVTEKPVKIFEFKDTVKKYSEELNMNPKLIERNLNVGFSGGEKKKNEILQMLVLNPKLAILDETDSGLDVDAIKIVSKGIEMFKNDDNAVLIITHNTRILNHLKVDYVHVLVNGQIVKTSTAELAEQIEETGYAQYKK